MNETLKILIVDDQPRTRASLAALLATKFSGVAIIEAANGAEAIQRVEDYKPVVVVMDVVMPEMNGLTATQLIKFRAPQTHIIVLSLYPEYRTAALVAGAEAFIDKDQSTEELLERIADIINGGV
jgi:DNA-binding NarL/FixJ family response regulator